MTSQLRRSRLLLTLALLTSSVVVEAAVVNGNERFLALSSAAIATTKPRASRSLRPPTDQEEDKKKEQEEQESGEKPGQAIRSVVREILPEKAPAAAPVSPSWLTRCAVTGVSCVTTWALVHYRNVPIARASSWQGIVTFVSSGGSESLTAASLAGAFAGMSSHLQHWTQTAILASLVGVLYAWESHTTTGLLKGKGGRLGTISVAASLVYFGLRGDKRAWTTLTHLAESLGGVPTVLGLTAAFGVLLSAKLALQQLAREQVKNYHRYRPLREAQSSPRTAWLRVARGGCKTAIAATLVTQLWQTQQSVLSRDLATTLLQSVGLVWACSLALYAVPGGKCLPLCLLGLVASYLPMTVTAPMCVGGLAGMTKLVPHFGPWRLLETAIWATLFLHFGTGNNSMAPLLAGLGGRLGAFTVLSVVLAHCPWW